MKKITIRSQKRNEAIDITPNIRKYLDEKRVNSGIITVFSPHTTAAITVNENTDPNVRYDLINHLNHLVPAESAFTHVEGNSDAHIKTSLFSPAQTLIVENGQIQLGTWQGIYLMEFDGPRTREVWLQFTSG
ncbi:MAG: YjbQ family protein [Candidatus Omnitrophica bacterium]|nr:YjbQ family protein [Candidatus Omnitrophota bacterium]